MLPCTGMDSIFLLFPVNTSFYYYFSMFPLLKKDDLELPAILLILFSNIVFGAQANESKLKLIPKIIVWVRFHFSR
jgi:hypothetical protein